MPRLGASAVAALLLLAALAPAALAIDNRGPEGPLRIGFDSDEEERVAKQLLNAFTLISLPENSTSHRVAAMAVDPTPPQNISTSHMAQIMGTLLAAAAVDAQAVDTLGDPTKFAYPDGSGRHAYFRFPTNTMEPKGTCIFIHGCKHDPMSWFYKSPKCPECTGLPEEVAHTKQCLARGYAVMALMSLDREYRARCFSSGKVGNDQPSSVDVLNKWMKKYGMQKKPKYIFGISSGASFAIKFPGAYKLDGVISEVNMPWADAWGAVDTRNNRLKYDFPPTVYYAMARDQRTMQQIQEGIQILRSNGVPSDYVFVPPRPVGPNWLYKRSIYISQEQSAAIQQALIKINVLDGYGNVNYDVRVKSGWTRKLPMVLPWLKRDSPYYNLISDESQIWQSLNLAWSWHEIVADYVRPTLMWLEKRGQANLAELVKQYSLNSNIRCLTEYREGCAGISNDQLLPAPAALPATLPATQPAATMPAAVPGAAAAQPVKAPGLAAAVPTGAAAGAVVPTTPTTPAAVPTAKVPGAAAAVKPAAAGAAAAVVPAAPVKPVAAAPVKPVAAAPVKPVAAAPVKPVAAAPVKPVAAAPVKPVAAAAPVKPVAAAPVKPVAAAPVKPVAAAPVKPVAAAAKVAPKPKDKAAAVVGRKLRRS